MRKLLLFIMLLFVAFTGFCQEVEKSVTALHKDAVTATSSVYQDATKATSTVYGDLKSATGVVYPDAKGAIGTLYSDGKKAIDFLVPKVESVITSLAEGLKTTSAKVWSILVYKQIALAITSTIYVIIGIILLCIYFWQVKKVVNKTKQMNDYWTESQRTFVGIFGLIATGILVFIIVQIPVIVNGFVVPEAGALNEIVGLTKELLKSF